MSFHSRRVAVFFPVRICSMWSAWNIMILSSYRKGGWSRELPHPSHARSQPFVTRGWGFPCSRSGFLFQRRYLQESIQRLNQTPQRFRSPSGVLLRTVPALTARQAVPNHALTRLSNHSNLYPIQSHRKGRNALEPIVACLILHHNQNIPLRYL